MATTDPQDTLVGACIRAMQQNAFYNAYRKTFHIVAADTQSLRERAFRLRYQVYAIENHFLDPAAYPDGLETDAFDARALHFLLIHRASGETAGTLRVLLPDDARPLVSFELQKNCSHPLLHIENRMRGLCEISRFCMAANFRRRLMDGKLLPGWHDQEDGGADEDGRPLFRRRIPYAPLGLLQAAFAAALDHGIHNCLMTVEASQLRGFTRMGLTGRTLGPQLALHGRQQPVIFNIKAVLDSMAAASPACWDVVTGRGRLQEHADALYRHDWHDSPA